MKINVLTQKAVVRDGLEELPDYTISYRRG